MVTRDYTSEIRNEAYTGFNFCEDGSFQDGNGNNTGGIANAVNALAGAVSNLQAYFDDTTASSLIDLFNKKALLARSKFKEGGVFANFGGWAGHDFGLFIGQVVNRNVLGLYIVSDGLYKVWLSDGTSSCSYVKVTTGNVVS